MSSQALWIKSKAKDSLNPAQVETTLNALAAAWNGPLTEFLRDFPLGEEALIHLLAVSQICAERLQRVPELLRWLARPEISMFGPGTAPNARRIAEQFGINFGGEFSCLAFVESARDDADRPPGDCGGFLTGRHDGGVVVFSRCLPRNRLRRMRHATADPFGRTAH